MSTPTGQDAQPLSAQDVVAQMRALADEPVPTADPAGVARDTVVGLFALLGRHDPTLDAALSAPSAPGALTEFLLARIAEDEAVAREAVSLRGGTQFLPGDEPEVPDLGLWANDDVFGGAVVSVGPERVLAECEAKRRLIDEAVHDAAAWDDERGCCHSADDLRAGVTTEGICVGASVLEGWLSILALPYADHEQFQDREEPPMSTPTGQDGDRS